MRPSAPRGQATQSVRALIHDVLAPVAVSGLLVAVLATALWPTAGASALLATVLVTTAIGSLAALAALLAATPAPMSLGAALLLYCAHVAGMWLVLQWRGHPMLEPTALAWTTGGLTLLWIVLHVRSHARARISLEVAA
jgi:hypothetical protein